MRDRFFAGRQQHGITMIGALLLLIICGFIALVLMKVIPMYIQYFSIKSSIDTIRKESNIEQMSPREIQNALQKRFDIGYIDNINARDLKVSNTSKGRVINLIYQDERAIFYGLYAVLKVDEQIPISP